MIDVINRMVISAAGDLGFADQLDPIIQLVETEMVGACLECHASGSLL